MTDFIPFSNLSPEDRAFVSRVRDMFHLVETKNVRRFSAFLDGRQQLLAQQVAKADGYENYLLFGGLEQENERRILGIFPFYESAEIQEFPIQPLSFRYRVSDKLSHRDFLGSFMSLNLKRETIGDILVGEGCAVVFVQPQAAQIIQTEIVKIGRVGVTIEPAITVPVPKLYTLQPISGTVSSLRLDCIVAFTCNQSREKAQQLIRAGSVTLQYQICEDTAQQVQQNDIFSVRGYGKFRLEQVGAITKKGRLHIVCSRYI